LQLGRALPALIALVVAAHRRDRPDARAASRAVATTILRGARDRSRDKHARPLLDQQARVRSLTAPRLRPARAA